MTTSHARTLDRDTVLCISLAARPSNIGTRFHNYLYNELNLNFVYKAFAPNDISAAVTGIRGLGIRGAAVSMPYKEQVIPLMDVMEPSAVAVGAVNTIVNDQGVLHAYNTDHQAVVELLRGSGWEQSWSVAVAGSGGMARAVVAALKDSGFTDVTVVARNERSGAALASRYGFSYRRWLRGADMSTFRPQLLINATPIGMADSTASEELPFPDEALSAALGVFDMVAMPHVTPLVRAACTRGLAAMSGDQVIARQAATQFALYTGIDPTPEQIAAASEYSRR